MGLHDQVLRELLFKEWQRLEGHSCDLGGSLPGLPWALGCLAARTAFLWNELISSCSVISLVMLQNSWPRSDSADLPSDVPEVV